MKKTVLGLLLLANILGAKEIYATFDVKAKQSANLAFDSSGIVEKVFVDNASIVKKGQMLAKLKNDDTKASLDIAKAEEQKAEVNLKYAQKDFERQEKIKKMIDEAKFDAYALAYESAKAALAKAKANVAYKRSLFEKTVMKAPFDGAIYAKDIEVGDAVSGMMLKTVFKIESITERKLVLEFDQQYNKDVKVGDQFRYKVDGDNKRYVGKITKIYPYADANNRKIKAEVEAKDFVVGLFGDGYIITK